MIEVRNLKFQPLTFHLRGGGESLHLGPRQRRVIDDDKVSPEMEQAARRGFVSLTDKTDDAPAGETQSTAAKPVGKRSRKGRN